MNCRTCENVEKFSTAYYCKLNGKHIPYTELDKDCVNYERKEE